MLEFRIHKVATKWFDELVKCHKITYRSLDDILKSILSFKNHLAATFVVTNWCTKL
jgi:hypothetical protein